MTTNQADPARSGEKAPLLDVRNIRTSFRTSQGLVYPVDNVSFSLDRGEVVAIVGESGCGKSITAFSVMGLLGDSGRVEQGEIFFEGRDISAMSREQMRGIQGNDISMIFQEPLTSLNPLLTTGYQIDESLRLHKNLSRKQAKEQSIDMLRKVGMPRPEAVYAAYPHELSGGMRQRVMIAMALSCGPKLLIADEPTTALDVTIQAQILKLMQDLRSELGTTIVLITHDLGVVAEMADRVIVMYAGQVVEQGDVYSLFQNPKHPYTRGLMNSTPKIHEIRDALESIRGTVPAPGEMPRGCRFSPRCPRAFDKCRTEAPVLQEFCGNYQVRCWLPEEQEVTLDEH
ncbi:ABC transporter ATP-binding protein [Candidimonas nitroreducens]|uniref:Peptide ABC transporter ATP-binding protein n=1 Tax=Candidimonas nitroreducens TaxID=683354 RepID=A0A225M826_9BURK|nr:ABC transporter ATP-binding protein [Candidimonas nitroreducens]OWT55711.1 peptide ABC transporter ATP-binding protein [Candidimonas nitroreducens]